MLGELDWVGKQLSSIYILCSAFPTYNQQYNIIVFTQCPYHCPLSFAILYPRKLALSKNLYSII